MCALSTLHVPSGSIASFEPTANHLTLFEAEAVDGSYFNHLSPEMLARFRRFCYNPSVVDRHAKLVIRSEGMHAALVRSEQGVNGCVTINYSSLSCGRPAIASPLSSSDRWAINSVGRARFATIC